MNLCTWVFSCPKIQGQGHNFGSKVISVSSNLWLHPCPKDTLFVACLIDILKTLFVPPSKVTLGLTKGGKLSNIITHKSSIFGPIRQLDHWLCTHALFDVTCFPANVWVSVIIPSVPFTHECWSVCRSGPGDGGDLLPVHDLLQRDHHLGLLLHVQLFLLRPALVQLQPRLELT